jgi:hypothetical protein
VRKMTRVSSSSSAKGEQRPPLTLYTPLHVRTHISNVESSNSTALALCLIRVETQ